MNNENQNTIEVDKLILGCGAAGIFLGQELLKRGDDNFLILEKEDRPGGLCRSFKMGSQYYDIGAHALHKKTLEKPSEFSRAIDVADICCQKRCAKVFAFDCLIPHPFQLHLFYAPIAVKIRCLIGYIRRQKVVANNLYDWLLSEFGNDVCRYFLFPYNQKVWKTDLKKISINWVSRVSTGSFHFFRGLLFAGNRNYSSNEFVCYPENGGFENFIVKGARSLSTKTALNCEIIKVDLEKKIAISNRGDVYKFNKLISTLPVDYFITTVIDSENKEIKVAVCHLEYVSTCLITFLTTKKDVEEQRVYIPEEKYLAQRVIVNSNSSKFLKKQNESLYSLEISFNKYIDLPNETDIIADCKKLLMDLRLIEAEGDIREFKIDFHKYTYPTQNITTDEIIKKVKEYLGKYACFTVGRFGSWNYANIDGIYEEVASLVKNNL